MDLGGAVSIGGSPISLTPSKEHDFTESSSEPAGAAHSPDAPNPSPPPASAHVALSDPDAAEAALARALRRSPSGVDGVLAAGGVGVERWRVRMLRRGQRRLQTSRYCGLAFRD